MRNNYLIRRGMILLLALVMALVPVMMTGCHQGGTSGGGTAAQETGLTVEEDGSYDSKEEVALYIHQYGELPGNYITKYEARSLGWSGGGLEDYAPGKCIGGDRFGNREGQLPKGTGESYFECDIDTMGKDSRGAKRIVYSSDGDIYYSEDHYETFTQLYDKEGEV